MFVLLLAPAAARAAQPPVELGTAGAFALLAGSTVTNTGPSIVNGDLGVAPGTAITGFPPAVLNGTVHAADAVAAQAQADLTAAYGDAAGRTPAAVLPADLGGLFLTAGVHRREAALGLTGDVTFDAQGDPNAVFIVQAGTLTTASDSRVHLTGRAQACKIFWQIASSATLGTDSALSGDFFAQQSITMNTRATLEGRALARSGAVTLDTNTIQRPDCTTGSGVPDGGTAPAPGLPPPGSPDPGTPGTTAPGTGSPGQTPSGPGTPEPGTAAPPGSSALGAGTAILATEPRSVGRTVVRFGRGRCVERSFRAVVTGVRVRRVNFLLDGRSVTIQDRAPFAARIRLNRGTHRLVAHVKFSDATRARSIGFRFRPCAQATRPAPGFTG